MKHVNIEVKGTVTVGKPKKAYNSFLRRALRTREQKYLAQLQLGELLIE